MLGIKPCSGWGDLVHDSDFGAQFVGHQIGSEVPAHKPCPCRRHVEYLTLPHSHHALIHTTPQATPPPTHTIR